MTRQITTNAALGGDQFTLDLDTGALTWGDRTAQLEGEEREWAQWALEAEHLGALRNVFDAARGSY
jgi:hypothetical protein